MNAIIYKKDNYMQTLKTLSKLIKTTPLSQGDALVQDKRYQPIVEYTREQLKQFTEEGNSLFTKHSMKENRF